MIHAHEAICFVTHNNYLYIDDDLKEEKEDIEIKEEIDMEEEMDFKKEIDIKKEMDVDDIDPIPVNCRCRSRCTAKKSCVCRQKNQPCTYQCHPGHSCTNERSLPTPSIAAIDLTNIKDTRDSDGTLWKNICGFHLHNKHLLMLKSSLEWLDDEIINASQQLLRKQYPSIGGFQSPLLAQTLAMKPQPSCEFVQILNASGNHWFTVSTIGCAANSINVYDSMNLQLSTSNEKLIADLMQSNEKELVINYVEVQYQSGGSDCGLFSIAFAKSLCDGKNPGNILYQQESMRLHLLKSIEEENITSFKERGVRRQINRRMHTVKLALFCICRLPEDGHAMIQCIKCQEWYHARCIYLEKNIKDYEQIDWYCPPCTNS